MSGDDVSPGRYRGLVWVLAAVAGGGAMAVGFLAGIPAALDSGGSGAGPWVVLFLVGSALVLVALAGGITGLLLPGRKLLSAIAVAIALVLALVVVGLFFVSGA